MTGRDLVTTSLRLIGAIATGESPSASEATDGLASINRMIDSWSNENLMIYDVVREQFALTAGTQSYTMGPSGVFSTTRPVEIETALLMITSGSTSIERPVDILNESQWAHIRSKGISTSVPYSLYVEKSFPNLTLNIYPIPSSSCNLVLYSKKQITSISSLDTVLSMPPGYERALIYNGALEMSPEYGKPVSDLVMKTAIESKAILKVKNYSPDYLRVENALVRRRSFNILTGEN